jgi:hypothetical protein
VPDDFSKYEAMKRSGSSADEVFREAVGDGVDPISRVRLIRAVFGLTPREAKDVVVRGEGVASSLDRHQERLAEELSRGSKAGPAPTGRPG